MILGLTQSGYDASSGWALWSWAEGAAALKILRSLPNASRSEVVTEIAIRSATPDDAARITAVHEAAVYGERDHGHYSNAQIDAWARSRSAARLRERIGARQFFVAELSRRALGYAQLDPGAAVLRSVYVQPELRRRGVGRRLTDALQWRLQYSRVIEKAGHIEGIQRLK